MQTEEKICRLWYKLSSKCLRLRSSAQEDAQPCSSAAWEIGDDCRGELIVACRARRLPRDQFQMVISPSLMWYLRLKFLVSSLGDKLSALQMWYNRFLMLLWRVIISPSVEQVRTWSPKTSIKLQSTRGTFDTTWKQSTTKLSINAFTHESGTSHHDSLWRNFATSNFCLQSIIHRKYQKLFWVKCCWNILTFIAQCYRIFQAYKTNQKSKLCFQCTSGLRKFDTRGTKITFCDL